jgi:hypothetical protein
MLDRVHKISEIIAAFAIVGSVIFVGLQVNQNTEAMDADQRLSSMKVFGEMSMAIATNESLADRLREDRYPAIKAASPRDGRDPQLMMWIAASMNTAESQYLLYLDGNLTGEIWTTFREGLIDNFASLASYELYWKYNRNIHSPRFRALVDELVPIAARRLQSYTDSTGFDEGK